MPAAWTVSPLHFCVWLLFFSLFCSASGIAAATLGIALFGMLAFRHRWKEIPHLPLFYPILGLVAALGLSVLLADGSGFAKPLGKLRYFLFYFFLVFYFSSFPHVRRRIAFAGVPLAWLLFVTAVLQFLGVFDLLHFSGATPVTLSEVQGSEGRFFHARGLLYHHNPFAFTSVALGFLMLGQSFVETSRARRFLLGGTAAIVPAIVLSGSRGAWLSLAVATLVVFGWAARRQWKTLAVLGAVLLIAGTAVSGALGRRAESIRPSANGERLRLWEIATEMFRESPWVGNGYHYGYELQRPRFMNEAEKANPFFPTDPHSLYFDLLATTGLVGCAAFLVFAVAAYVSYVRGLRAGPSASSYAALATGLGCWTAFMVGSAFDSHFFHTQTLMTTLFFLSFGQSAVFPKREAARSSRR